MIDILELEAEFSAFYDCNDNKDTLLARMFPMIAEIKRLRQRLHLAEEYIRNPVSWNAYAFELLNKNLDGVIKCTP